MSSEISKLRCEFGFREGDDTCDRCQTKQAIGKPMFFLSDGGYEPRDGTYVCRKCAVEFIRPEELQIMREGFVAARDIGFVAVNDCPYDAHGIFNYFVKSNRKFNAWYRGFWFWFRVVDRWKTAATGIESGVDSREDVAVLGAAMSEGLPMDDELIVRLGKEKNDLLDTIHACLIVAAGSDCLDELERQVKAAGDKPSEFVRARIKQYFDMVGESNLEIAQLKKDNTKIREVWSIMDQTIGCNFCGHVEWEDDTGEIPKHSDDCPIGYMMNNWKKEVAELKIALQESIKLQSHYANLLNMHDGGARMLFGSPEKWIERLRECGTIK